MSDVGKKMQQCWLHTPESNSPTWTNKLQASFSKTPEMIDYCYTVATMRCVSRRKCSLSNGTTDHQVTSGRVNTSNKGSLNGRTKTCWIKISHNDVMVTGLLLVVRLDKAAWVQGTGLSEIKCPTTATVANWRVELDNSIWGYKTHNRGRNRLNIPSGSNLSNPTVTLNIVTTPSLLVVYMYTIIGNLTSCHTNLAERSQISKWNSSDKN